ncbi:LysR family transcriptional regulator [Bradyrhizobium sp. CSA207]|uniref:helix-turn-helix domain-containing protein n=1 Tax=Bradyrhizobium sp. CSA207 TaxID=2698826 RepID=UPI0023AEB68A|nr:LysR family transcriptional regulator [Bradyrhizobium sp. CSA207]
MDSTDLNFFTAVAMAGGIGRAANDLHLQSNVTQRIRALEVQLGVQLFHRSKKGLRSPRWEQVASLRQSDQRAFGRGPSCRAGAEFIMPTMS